MPSQNWKLNKKQGEVAELFVSILIFVVVWQVCLCKRLKKLEGKLYSWMETFQLIILCRFLIQHALPRLLAWLVAMSTSNWRHHSQLRHLLSILTCNYWRNRMESAFLAQISTRRSQRRMDSWFNCLWTFSKTNGASFASMFMKPWRHQASCRQIIWSPTR